MTIILTVVGPAAEYGSFGRWPLLVASLGYWGSMFATMSLTSPSRWVVAMGIYIIGNVSYRLTGAFYSAIFPRLARNTTHSRELRKKYDQNEISKDVYEKGEALEKSKISSLSITSAAVGGTTMLLLSLTLLVLLKGKTRANNYVIVLSTAYGIVTGAWWFIFQQPRPGPKIPKGEHYLTIGWRQIWISLKQYQKLPNTFIYLIAYFFLADGQNTTMTLVQICQNVLFKFSFKQSTYLGIVQGASSTMGIIAYYRVSLRAALLEDGCEEDVNHSKCCGRHGPTWGMIGIRTNKIGFHNRWEFWVYSVMVRFSQAPSFTFSQTVMSELSPPGFDFMFFGLYGLTGRASSIVGPIVTQAIINKTDNNWHGFPFLFAICLAAILIICLAVDVPTGRRDAERWAVDKRGTAYDVYSDGKVEARVTATVG
ncbi:autophagy-related protein 22-like protein [Russula dissimulans]|nr:autophagy-related protein 22-like protein [Russula dissimulans]